jgi:putative YpdA family bacillithiol system oxidoreductase
METLVTTLILGAITVLAIRRHLRRTGGSSDQVRGDAAVRTCPRCSATVTAGAVTCPGCRVPLNAYELVTAASADDGETPGPGSGKKIHAVLRSDMCVGCGACVDACAEPKAISMVGKQAVVDLDACIGLGDCAEACPVNALVLATGEAVQRIEVPETDVNFETNIPGLYIVGELGGRGLIKNAVNEGKIAAEHVTREVRAKIGTDLYDPDVLDVVIVGSGPAGLSTGLEAHRAGLSYLVLERGSLADSIRKYPRHKLMLAEPVTMPLYGDLWIVDASKESLLTVWESIIESTGLNVRTGHDVVAVRKDGDRFLVDAGGAQFPAWRVVLATGGRGKPRRLGVPGEDLPKILYDILEMEVFRGRRVLVVGGGDSAVESAVGLSRQEGTDVTLSYRGDEFKRIKDRNRDKLGEAVQSGEIRLFLKSKVVEVRPETVLIDVEGRASEIPNDDVIVRIGGEPPYEFLKRVGIRLVKKDVPIPGGATLA